MKPEHGIHDRNTSDWIYVYVYLQSILSALGIHGIHAWASEPAAIKSIWFSRRKSNEAEVKHQINSHDKSKKKSNQIKSRKRKKERINHPTFMLCISNYNWMNGCSSL